MESSVDRIADPWGGRVPHGRHEPWPVRVDTHLAEDVEPGAVQRWVQAASILHSDGDAMDIAVVDGRMVGVRGRAVDRVNRGRLGPKDLFGWQANASPDRLTRPLVREGGRLVETDWDTAMDRVVSRSRELLDERGAGSLGFYTSGQLFLEEYYTLAVLARAGIGTNHLDGNTRLCTSTAAEALKESFGCDGQPGSYDDIDHADVIALFGHNIAETQPVQWMRVLDRLEGTDPPRLLCVDPRPTPVARRAAVHLAPRIGTNVALLNALLHEAIRTDRVDHDYVRAHTVGFEELAARVADCTPEWAAGVCDVPAARIAEAAELLGTADRLLSTVLQGVYQSHQATAAAVQVNNLHLIRGMLGRPGAGVLQMNGQPTAQNTRECGANGDLPGFRNWQNDAHVEDLARVWNVEPSTIPHYAPPTHALQMFRYAEQGSIRMLWISGTNPAVSLPELARIRSRRLGPGVPARRAGHRRRAGRARHPGAAPRPRHEGGRPVNGVTLVLRALHQGERDLVDGLVALAERHRAEHEVHHVATDVASWSREHVRRLADTAAHYGLDLDGPGLDGPPGGSSPDLFAAPRKKAPDPAGGPSDPGLLLLRDLREAHLAAAHNSLHWEMLAQAAQALRDHRLLALASFCHPRTLRQMRWTNTMIKNLSPQLLTSL